MSVVFFVLTFISYSQKRTSNLEQVKPNQINTSLSSGISTPSSSFSDRAYAENGIYFELIGSYYFSKFGFGASLGQYTNSTDANLNRFTNSLNFSTENATEDWKVTYYGFGPEYSTSFNKIRATLLLRTGILSIKPITLKSNYIENIDIAIPIYNAFTEKTSNISYISTAVKFGYNFNQNLSVFATVDYMSALSNEFTITEKTITDANRNGTIDLEDFLKLDATSVTFDETVTQIKPQTTNFGVGLSYTFNTEKPYARANGSPLYESGGSEGTMVISDPSINDEENQQKIIRDFNNTNKLDADSDGDGLSDSLEISNDADNDCDSGNSSVKRMNKGELVDAIAKDANLSKADAKRALETLTANLLKSIGNGGDVQVVDFQQSISKRTARTGRNPQTGATIKIAAKKVEVRGWDPKNKKSMAKTIREDGRTIGAGDSPKTTSKKGYDYYKAASDSSKRTDNSQNPQENGGEIQMNKGELIDAIAKDANLSKADAGKALNVFIASISKKLNKGKCLRLIVPVAINKGNIQLTNPAKEKVDREKKKRKLLNVLPKNNSNFNSVAEIESFTWEQKGYIIRNPQYVIEVVKTGKNKQPQRTYIAKTTKTSIKATVLFKEEQLSDGNYTWKVTETTTGTVSNPSYFTMTQCEIDFAISNEEIECLGYEGENRKFKICFDVTYSSTSGDLTYLDPSSGLTVYDQTYATLSHSLVSPNPTLISQIGATTSTVSYCFEVTVAASVTSIGFGLQGDDLDPSPITCQPGVSSMFDDLPDCICDECEDIEVSFDDFNISLNEGTGNQFNFNGNLNVNVPIYGIEFQVQSYSYTATPSACTEGVNSVAASGMILMPGTSINGSTSLQLFNETASGNPSSNNNATKDIKYTSNSPLTGPIPINLTIGLPGPISGLDPSCCTINYEVCIKVKIFYEEGNCKSCVFTHCFTFNNQ